MAIPKGFSYHPSSEKTKQRNREGAVDPSQGVLWNPAGVPYMMTAGGTRSYFNPMSAGTIASPTEDETHRRLREWAESQGVFTTGNDTGGGYSTKPTGWRESGPFSESKWNPEKGRYERDWDRTSLLMTIGAGGVIGAGAAAALAGGGAAVAGAPVASTAGAAGTTGATAAGATGATAAGTGAAFTPTVVAPSAYSLTAPAMFGATGTAALPAAAAPIGAAVVPAAAGVLAGNPALWSDVPPGYETETPPSSGSSNMNWGQISKWIDRAGDIWGAIGEPAQGAAQGLADDRNAQNNWRTQRDNTLALLARDEANFGLLGAQSLYDRNRLQSRDIYDTGLQSAEFDRTGQSREMRQALLSGLIGGAQDAKITPGNPRIAERMPTITGGARPSMLAGSKDSIMGLLGKPQIQAPTYNAPAPYAAPAPYKPPTLSSFEDPGAAENWLGGLGLVGKAWDAYNRRNEPRQPPRS